MKKVFIYGDSNTWGDNFNIGKRIPDEKQWPNILQQDLDDDFKFIVEALPGRIAGNEELEKTYKNGRDSFLSIFRSQAPVDIVIISLGTNDLNKKYNKSHTDIIYDLLWYKEAISKMFEDPDDKKKFFVNNVFPKFIYILPVNFDYKNNASVIFNENSENERKKLIEKFPKCIENVKVLNSNEMPLFDDRNTFEF